MQSMVEYLEDAGFKATKEYKPKLKVYEFIISRGENRLIRNFTYPSDKSKLDYYQRFFLDKLIYDFEECEKCGFDIKSMYPTMLSPDKIVLESLDSDSEWITTEDMVRMLEQASFTVHTEDRKNSVGQHEVHFTVSRRGNKLHRILNEYDIGGLTEIQRNRRYFLKEIIKAFIYEEKGETDMSKTIKWTVDNIKLEEIRHDGDFNITAELIGSVMPAATGRVYGAFNPLELHRALQTQLDAEMVATNTLWPKTNPNIQSSTKLPKIKKVIFNNPATIIIWADKTKTVVKAQNNETYDPEKGLAMAISKKALGNERNYFETFKKYLKECDIPSEHSSMWLATQRLYNALGDKKATKADLRFAMEEAIKYLEG